MGRNLSSIVKRELKNLDKDADSRKSAMKVLKSYAKDLDSKAIPLFLAQVSESEETGSSFGEYTISLYEVLARVHGLKIVPQIDNIMTSITKTLASNAGSFGLHQACSKVVPAIARYGIDPSTPEDKKRQVIHSLCKPLSDCLLGSQENLSSGAALCLKALVESDNWRFASNEMVNVVCQKVSGALEKHAQVNSHLALVMALAKHNSLIVEAYARLLIQSGLRILNVGFDEGISQKRFSAIQMVNFLMKSLDPKSIFSEVGLIIEEMEKCQSDQMAYVRGAAFEALQTARRIFTDKGSKCEIDVGSITGSNNSTRESSRGRNLWGAGDQSHLIASPESQTVNSSAVYDSLIESPISVRQASCDLICDARSVNRKLWTRHENGGVDVSLKDGIFSEVTRGNAAEHSEYDKFSDNQGHTDDFAGFLQGSLGNGVVNSTTPSPQRSRSYINVDNVKIFTTPRKLIQSLQDPNDLNSDFSRKQTRLFKSPSICKFEWSHKLKPEQTSSSQESETDLDENLSNRREQQFNGSSESVSSTEDTPAGAVLVVPEKVVSVSKSHAKSLSSLICCFFVLLMAVLVGLSWIDGGDEGHNLVPT